MVVLYASERNWLALHRPEFPLAGPVIGTVAWPAFLALASEAECCVVAIPAGPRAAVLDDLRAFRAAAPRAPLVLVADRSLPSAVATLGEVVRPPIQLRRLWPAMQRACTTSLLLEAAELGARAERHAVVRAAFVAACRADPPIHGVAALAALAGCHRRTLWRHWRAVADDAGAPSLEGLLDWILVLRACVQYRGPRRWATAAAHLGVHRHTLARAVAGTTGGDLAALTPDAVPDLRAAFRCRVLAPFIGTRA